MKLIIKIYILVILCAITIISQYQTRYELVILLFIASFIVFSIGVYTYRDWKSPLCYFPPIFFLYYGIFPIYFYMGGDRILGVPEQNVEISIRLSILYLLGSYIAFLFMVNQRKYNLKSFKINTYPEKIFKIFIFIFILLYSYSFLQIYTSGGLSKAERMTSGVASFAMFFGGIYFYFLNILIRNYFVKSTINYIFFVVLLLGIFGYIFQGERDQLIFPLVMTFFVYSYFNKVSFSKILFIGLVFFVILFLLGVYRSYMESGDFRNINSILYILQENEFISTGRNLSSIVDIQNYLYGYTYIGDFLHALFIGNFIPTGSTWFSDNYYENKGFSLIGEAYINFGAYGAFFIGFLVTFIMLQLYKNSFKNSTSMVVFIILSVAFMYSFRSDLAAITSGFVKKIIIPFIILKVSLLILEQFIYKPTLKKYNSLGGKENG